MPYDTVEQRVISNQYGVCRPRVLRAVAPLQNKRERRARRGERAARMHRADLEGNVMHSVAIIAR